MLLSDYYMSKRERERDSKFYIKWHLFFIIVLKNFDCTGHPIRAMYINATINKEIDQ